VWESGAGSSSPMRRQVSTWAGVHPDRRAAWIAV